MHEIQITDTELDHNLLHTIFHIHCMLLMSATGV